LVTSDGKTVAGEFTRQGGAARCWVIPPYEDQVVDWLLAALNAWSHLDSARFPVRQAWRQEERWQVSKERELIAELRQLEVERNNMLTEVEMRMTKVRGQLENAQAEGEVDRKLLTTQGDELVAAVRSALRNLGFDVAAMDERWPVSDKREDLRVTDVSVNDWEAIAEVRGYKRGAELSDLMRLSRFAKRYQQDEGRYPDGVWYIANHFIPDSPSERSAILASHPKEVDAFADDDGLIVDTRHLFDMVVNCQIVVLQKEDAREKLRNGRGRYAP
jgi:hypothetical protein